MKLISARCPNRRNPRLRLAPGQETCQCEYCGSKFVVEWSDSGDPQLGDFHSALQEAITHYQFLAADRRLDYLGDAIAKAREEVEGCKKQREQAVAEYKTLATKRSRDLQNAKTGFWAAVVAAVAAWILVFVALRGRVVYVFVLVGLVAMSAAVVLYSQWRNTQGQLTKTLRTARSKIDQAHSQLIQARNCLQDLFREKELCTERVRSYTYTEDTNSAVTRR